MTEMRFEQNVPLALDSILHAQCLNHLDLAVLLPKGYGDVKDGEGDCQGLLS